MCENIQSDAVEMTRMEMKPPPGLEPLFPNAQEPPRHVSLFKQLPSCLTLPSTCFNNTVCFPFLILCDYMMQSKKVYMTNKHTISGMFRMCCLFLTCNADFFCDMINIYLIIQCIYCLDIILSLFCDHKWIQILSTVCIYKIFLKTPPGIFHQKFRMFR